MAVYSFFPPVQTEHPRTRTPIFTGTTTTSGRSSASYRRSWSPSWPSPLPFSPPPPPPDARRLRREQTVQRVDHSVHHVRAGRRAAAAVRPPQRPGPIVRGRRPVVARHAAIVVARPRPMNAIHGPSSRGRCNDTPCPTVPGKSSPSTDESRRLFYALARPSPPATAGPRTAGDSRVPHRDVRSDVPKRIRFPGAFAAHARQENYSVDHMQLEIKLYFRD